MEPRHFDMHLGQLSCQAKCIPKCNRFELIQRKQLSRYNAILLFNYQYLHKNSIKEINICFDNASQCTDFNLSLSEARQFPNMSEKTTQPKRKELSSYSPPRLTMFLICPCCHYTSVPSLDVAAPSSLEKAKHSLRNTVPEKCIPTRDPLRNLQGKHCGTAG